MVKILDCTLRDGGYYTNWDFDKELVDQYIKSTNNLPVDYLEVGYRSIAMKEYLGKYFYCPVFELEDIKKKSNRKLVIILNEKDTRVEDLPQLLAPILGLVHMIRIALDPQHLVRAIKLAERIKSYGFEVGFNVMYMSKWNEYGDFIKELKNVDGVSDYFYMVDSYGGVFPEDVINTIELVKAYTSCKIGFHGHNNLEMALVNSLTAIEHGVEIIDSTIGGMGRGAGNLKTELILSVLNKKFDVPLNYNALGEVVGAFDGLLKKYEWGTNLPYMISGANSLPQKDVMDWVTTRFYSFNSIIRALENQTNKLKDNQELPVFEPTKAKEVLIIGGGKNAREHATAINEFIKRSKDILIIHASSKNAYLYKNLEVPQIFCLVGSEGHRLEKVFNDLGEFDGICVLPPFPRKMGTYIPSSACGRSYELSAVDFTSYYKDSHTALALQTAINAGAQNIYVAGYDGYQDSDVSPRERTLTQENEHLFNTFKQSFAGNLYTLNSSNYKCLEERSVYSLI